MIQAVIFDFDGVIVDTETRKFLDLQKLLKKYGRVLNKRDKKSMIGKKTAFFLKERYPQLNSKEIRQINNTRKRLQYRAIEKYRLIPGLQRVMKFLRSKKITLVIATGSEKNFVEKILKKHHLRDFFNVVVTEEDCKASKPKPDIFLLTLKKLGLPANKVVIIEDAPAGIEAAKKAQCKVFGLATYLPKKKLKEADETFKNHFDLLRKLKKYLA